jgi:SAM-dependent methyltransferase
VPHRDANAPDQEAIWDYFQNEAPETFEGSRARIEYLVSRAGNPGAKVLNIGVGSGIFERKAINRGLDVYSLDPSARSIEQLRAECGLGVKAQTGYAQEIPFEGGHFDTVVISEVLEHLSNEIIGETLEEVQRVLKLGGRLIGTVPAREDLAANMVVCPDCSKRFHRWGHQQRFDAARLTEVLAARFDVIAINERPFIDLKMLNRKGKLFGLAKLLQWRFGVHGGYENLVFEVAKS